MPYNGASIILLIKFLPMPYSIFLPDETATLQLGQRCASLFQAPTVIYLQGDLGAGKTTFVRGFLRGLGYLGNVKSPTYAVVESYQLPEKNIHHFDLYRFSYPEEWEDAGLDELFQENSICLIEWANQGGDYVPKANWIIDFQHQKEGRCCQILPQHSTQQQELTLWQK